jgi:hypothetical protein
LSLDTEKQIFYPGLYPIFPDPQLLAPALLPAAGTLVYSPAGKTISWPRRYRKHTETIWNLNAFIF